MSKKNWLIPDGTTQIRFIPIKTDAKIRFVNPNMVDKEEYSKVGKMIIKLKDMGLI